MKTGELLNRNEGTVANIARQLVGAAIKDFRPEDVLAVATKSCNKFSQQLMKEIKNEVFRQLMVTAHKTSPNSEI